MAEANLNESGKDFSRDHNAKSYLFLGSAMCAMDKIPGKLLPNLLEYFFCNWYNTWKFPRRHQSRS